ncbi:MAG: hypothetical protein WC637_06880 [Victivallales bacterium]|jgi:hypothetical protein
MNLNNGRFKKFLLIVGGFLLALFAIFAISYMILNIKWGGELNRELEKLKNSGEPMTIKDISPAVLAPSDNASAEYMQIFSLMTDGTFSKKSSGGDGKDLKELNALCLSSKTMEDYEGQCRKNSARIGEILDKESFRQIYELCQKAASKPGVNFDLNYEDGPALLLPHLGCVRSISRLMRLKAEMELHEGRREKGWETILTGFKLNSQLKTEPLLISQLVYFAGYNSYFDFIAYNLPRYGISDEQAGKLILELTPDRIAYAQSMRNAINAERICLGGWVYERLLSGSLNTSEIIGMTNSPNTGYFMPFMYIFKPFAKKDYLEYLKIMERYNAEFNQPYYKIAFSMEKAGDEMIKSLPKYCFLSRLLCPALGRMRLKTAEMSTRSQEMRLMLALEEYKNLKKEYPDKIEQLSTQFMPAMPVSELTGRPFEYSRESGGYNISGGISVKK